jgi:hypothetical protein
VGELYSQLLAHETRLVLVGKHSPPQTMPCMDMAVLQEVMVEAIPMVEAILATVVVVTMSISQEITSHPIIRFLNATRGLI